MMLLLILLISLSCLSMLCVLLLDPWRGNENVNVDVRVLKKSTRLTASATTTTRDMRLQLLEQKQEQQQALSQSISSIPQEQQQHQQQQQQDPKWEEHHHHNQLQLHQQVQLRAGDLSCVEYGGPNPTNLDTHQDNLATATVLREMVYWYDIPTDAIRPSRQRRNRNTHHNRKQQDEQAQEQYLTFEPDKGRWNNVRMNLETVIALAYAMGRTLVLPHAQEMERLRVVVHEDASSQQQPQKQQHRQENIHNQNARTRSNNVPWSFPDSYFDVMSLTQTYAGINIITTQEFVRRQRQRQQASNDSTTTPVISIPRDKTLDWNGNATNWKLHLQNQATNLIWDFRRCIAYFPDQHKGDDDSDDSTKNKDEVLQSMQQRFRGRMRLLQEQKQKLIERTMSPDELMAFPPWMLFTGGSPPPLNMTEMDRLVELSANRSELCLYTQQLQKEPVLHIPAEVLPLRLETKTKRVHIPNKEWKPRLLAHFYQFVFFANVHEELWLKRVMRDRLRYNNAIQCAAARVVAAIRHKIRTVHGRPDGLFHSMHIRRDDFQAMFNKTEISAQQLFDQATSQHFQEGDVVFVATDEKDKSFFRPLQQHYTLYFLDDFVHELGGTNDDDTGTGLWNNPNYYIMMDQLVAAQGQLFFGCWFSTFTGYIMRLRGYHSQFRRSLNYEQGILPTSYYYTPVYKMNQMTHYHPMVPPLWAREHSMAWRLLNRDVVVNPNTPKHTHKNNDKSSRVET